MAESAPQPGAPDSLTPSEREQVYRHNYRLFLADFLLFSVGMSLLGTTTVIPAFIRGLTDSEVLIGLSSQLFEIGWLLPQLLVARWLVSVANKKWWFAAPNIPVRLLILVLAGVIVLLGPERKTAILIAFLVLYAGAALGDGLVGVPWVDLIGSSLDGRRRARLFGLGTAFVGIAMLGLNPIVQRILSDEGPPFPNNYALLFAISGTLFTITIIPPMFLRELPSATPQVAPPSMRDYLPQLGRVLRTDHPFRAVIIARVLLSLATLAGPFYIGFATEQLGMSSDIAVSNLLLMQTLGSVAGSLALSWMGDRQIVLFIRLVITMALLQPALALLASAVGPAPLYLAYVMAGVVIGSLNLSLTNWVVMYASPDQRPIYAGLFNSAAAVTLIVAPLMGGTIVELLGYEVVFVMAFVIVSAALGVVLRSLVEPRVVATTS